eukprot:1024185-Rhodomonas_salina.1
MSGTYYDRVVHDAAEEDWEIVTEDGELCDHDHKLDQKSFHYMLKRQLKHFVQRHTVSACPPSVIV